MVSECIKHLFITAVVYGEADIKCCFTERICHIQSKTEGIIAQRLFVLFQGETQEIIFFFFQNEFPAGSKTVDGQAVLIALICIGIVTDPSDDREKDQGRIFPIGRIAVPDRFFSVFLKVNTIVVPLPASP